MTRRLIAVYKPRLLAAVSAVALVGACSDGLDIDLRGSIGNNFDTSAAARDAATNRPDPDSRGIISYPTYQVAVARRGDTVNALAARVGLPASDIAKFNGLNTQDTLRRGEIIALPRRVEDTADLDVQEIDALDGAPAVDITELASNAIDSAEDTAPVVKKPAVDPKPDLGPEPVRHKVKRGETVYTLSRLYGISVRSIADWNSLDRNFTIREGQYLLIPQPEGGKPLTLLDNDDSKPGEGSATPQPPSAKKPLPEDVAKITEDDPVVAEVEIPDIGQKPAAEQKATSAAAMSYPVSGPIIRAYSKGRNDGIDIGAAAGTDVKAAASGVVAHVSETPDGVPILLIRHPNNVTTIYTNLDGITVKKDDSVSRGQRIGKVRAGSTPYLHFETREGYESVDPMTYLN